MRDHLCDKEKCRKRIDFYKRVIVENSEEIKTLEEDIKNGIKRYPNDNESIIDARYSRNCTYYIHNSRAKYSLGDEPELLKEGYEDAINDLENIREKEVS